MPGRVPSPKALEAFKAMAMNVTIEEGLPPPIPKLPSEAETCAFVDLTALVPHGKHRQYDQLRREGFSPSMALAMIHRLMSGRSLADLVEDDFGEVSPPLPPRPPPPSSPQYNYRVSGGQVSASSQPSLSDALDFWGRKPHSIFMDGSSQPSRLIFLDHMD